MRFVRWDYAAMLAALAVVFGFEMMGVAKPGKFVTITWLAQKYVPLQARFFAWCWLGWHFVFRHFAIGGK